MNKFLVSLHTKVCAYLLLTLGFTQALKADCISDADCCVTESGGFTFNVEFLYFKPTIDQSYYVVSSTNNVFGEDIHPNGTRHNNHSKHHPAFRLEALYGLCDCFNEIDLRFTYFNGGHSDSTTGSFLFDTVGFPGNGSQSPEDTSYAGTAEIKHSFRYYAGDLTYNRIAFDCCPDNLTFLVGLHYAYIQFKERFLSFGSFLDDSVIVLVSNHLNRDSQFWGIGPQFGVDYRYCLPSFCCFESGAFSLGAQARASLLCSHTEARFHYVTTRTGVVGVNLHNDPLWRVTPAVDARLGLRYDFCICCFNGSIELGYEWIWYSNCIDSIVGYDVAFAGDSIDAYSSLSLQGPFLAFGISF